MRPTSPTLLTLIAIAAAGCSPMAPTPKPMAESVPAAPHAIPQSLRIAQDETVERLSTLSRRKGSVGIEAGKALVIFQRHIAREQEFILPPLTLLPRLADGQVTPDMAWALPMTDRVRAEREAIFAEHTKITDALNALAAAASRAHDRDARAFAESAAADSLNDMEILEPTLLLIGDILHSKLPAGR